jgi:hypothetical protein
MGPLPDSLTVALPQHSEPPVHQVGILHRICELIKLKRYAASFHLHSLATSSLSANCPWQLLLFPTLNFLQKTPFSQQVADHGTVLVLLAEHVRAQLWAEVFTKNLMIRHSADCMVHGQSNIHK